MKRAGAAVYLVLACAAQVFAQTTKRERAADEPHNVRVQLFSTASIASVQVRSHGTTVRACPRCPVQPLAGELELSAAGNNVQAKGGSASPQWELRGSLELATPNGRHAVAAGAWVVSAAHGELHVSVELSMERYVAAVLAAEAAPDEPPAALAALAVAARSFAQTQRHRHGTDDVCDSTHCQAMRLVPPTAAIAEAVRQTSDETLWFGGHPVPAYFSQNCGGTTEDAAAAWGGAKRPWLVSHADPYCLRRPSQWHASLPESQVREALRREGWALASPLRSAMVEQRDPSGRARSVLLQMASGQQTISASSLRFALDRSLGWNQLRSDRYALHVSGSTVVFDGDGAGHGVGLCQAGAAEQAREGKSYRDILHFYFPGAQVRVQAGDEGWRETRAGALTLRTTAPDDALEQQAEHALGEAHSRWPFASAVRPTLTVYPSTELFRQGTGQPGWTLAVTQGSQVASQNAAVLQSHGGAAPLLRHEFLHVLVEADTRQGTPLWLREGLVEVLAGEICPAVPRMDAAAVEQALQHADSLAASQAAHIAACSLVQQQVARQGLAAVHAQLQGAVRR